MYGCIGDSDDRVGYHALWVFSHFGREAAAWLRPRRDELVDMLLAEKHTGKRRLLLTLLDRQAVAADDVRTDYLDWCLRGINSTQPYGVRALCLKQSYAMCRFYPELLRELACEMELMECGELSPGLRATLRHVRDMIREGKKE